MPRRKRDYIPWPERYAAACAALHPEVVKHLRGDLLLGTKDAPASEVIKLFTNDHGILHAHGGADTWGNLTPRPRGAELKAKDIRDTKIAAKSKRILTEQGRMIDGVLIESGEKLFLTKGPSSPLNGIYTASVKPKRKFPQGRKLQSRSTFRRSNAKKTNR